mmetsp:Transcript_128242/g.399292  ORF Transcript_128242/g.399292 Transcript_128242/m.399292 type:complete len:96 (-) Transcript_128242:207-494(-)
MSIPDKQELAVACGMRWACQVRCDQDYSAVCPKAAVTPALGKRASVRARRPTHVQAWVHMFGLCMAPAGYAGPRTRAPSSPWGARCACACRKVQS